MYCVVNRGLNRLLLKLQIRRQWCQILNRPELINVTDRHERQKFRVCDIHFTEDSKFQSSHNRTNLKYTAVPKLHLGGKI